MKHISFVIITIVLVTLTGCQSMFERFVGYKPLKQFDMNQYESFVGDLSKDFSFVSIISTKEQSLAVSEFDTMESNRQHLVQPIQILYFEHDSLVSYHINCTAPAKGFNLDWNYEQRFETFPPKSPLPCDSIDLSLSKYNNVYPEIIGGSPYTVLVFWTNILAKVSRTAIKTVFNNCKKTSHDKDCRIYLINDDNFIIDVTTEE